MDKMSESEFSDIRPYTDEEARVALCRVASHPLLPIISRYLFPDHPVSLVSGLLKQVQSVDQFQDTVMMQVICSVLDKTSKGFEVSGMENLTGMQQKFLAVSNHRDIVLDPALIQYAVMKAGLPYTQICVGSNLLKSGLIEDLMRSNRMIKVIRGIGARELYLSSQILSKYIRQSITTGEASVWIAQREGRTKDGYDTTEQGLLKMFDMSGQGSFEDNFDELNVMPMSISYEYEPCDWKKAREIMIKKTTGSYTKKPNEDTHSILTGIRQQKGHIHLSIGKELTREEIERAAACKGNERYQEIRHILDNRIVSGYKLWKTNYMGYDLMNGTSRYLGVEYTMDDLAAFKAYTDHKLSKVERKIDREGLYQTFYEIYGNPVKSKLEL